MQLNNICALVCCSALLHRTAADLMKIECRLVEGVTVKDHFSKLCLSGTAESVSASDALTIQQQVLEVAVQLIHVCHVVNRQSSTSSSLAFH